MNKDSKIYIAGHTGLVGSAILRRLQSDGYTNIVTRTHKELDLCNQRTVNNFFWDETPEYVFMAAARVGGVAALNKYRAEAIYDNLMIQNNVIHSSHKFEVKKLLFLGSNCLYPKLAAQPIKEEYLMAGKLEPTTEAYAIAKIAGIKMCQAYREQYGKNFIIGLPVNLYGQNDNYDHDTAHALPALLSKFHKAQKNNLPSVTVWGSGMAKREFMHVDDVADACFFLMLNYDESDPVNIGTGADIHIKDLAELIKKIVDYNGELIFDRTKPEGIMSKVLDISKISNIGWKHKISLEEGIKMVYSKAPFAA